MTHVRRLLLVGCLMALLGGCGLSGPDRDGEPPQDGGDEAVAQVSPARAS